MKNWYQSRTIWWNALSALVIIAGVLVDPSLGFDPRIVVVATAVVTAGNAVLRLITSVPIAGTPAAAAVSVVPPVAS